MAARFMPHCSKLAMLGSHQNLGIIMPLVGGREEQFSLQFDSLKGLAKPSMLTRESMPFKNDGDFRLLL